MIETRGTEKDPPKSYRMIAHDVMLVEKDTYGKEIFSIYYEKHLGRIGGWVLNVYKIGSSRAKELPKWIVLQ